MPLNSNSASDRPARAAGAVPFATAGYMGEPVRRLSPLASLVVLTLLSLGGWAAIWATVFSLASR
jgi:hypothetical protein